MIDSPSGRVPEKASRWDVVVLDLAAAEKVFRWISDVRGIFEYLYMWNYGWRCHEGPTSLGAPLELVAPSCSSGLLPNLLGSLLVQKKLIQSFFSVWTSFDIDF